MSTPGSSPTSENLTLSINEVKERSGDSSNNVVDHNNDTYEHEDEHNEFLQTINPGYWDDDGGFTEANMGSNNESDSDDEENQYNRLVLGEEKAAKLRESAAERREREDREEREKKDFIINFIEKRGGIKGVAKKIVPACAIVMVVCIALSRVITTTNADYYLSRVASLPVIGGVSIISGFHLHQKQLYKSYKISERMIIWIGLIGLVLSLLVLIYFGSSPTTVLAIILPSTAVGTNVAFFSSSYFFFRKQFRDWSKVLQLAAIFISAICIGGTIIFIIIFLILLCNMMQQQCIRKDLLC